MNILIIGSGGREHALAKKLSESESCSKLFASPGNPGILRYAEKADIEQNNFKNTASFCKSNDVDLVVIGPEQPLADGIADFLRMSGIAVFGPSSAAARLESSKSFAKDFMAKYNIPSSSYKAFNKNHAKEAHEYLERQSMPIVLKADGLAAGKGVFIASSYHETHGLLDSIFGGLFGNAGDSVVIEEFMPGEEASVLAITDGKDFVTLAPSQDHKRIGDGDTGKNTGGMGAYAPAPLVDEILTQKINNQIIEPAIAGMNEEGTPFVGCLYAGLMINNGEPKVVEFNVRFGDPETQAVLTVFSGDLAKLLYSAAIGRIDKSAINNINDGFATCVVLASGGYPDSFQKNFTITGIEQAEHSGAIVYHAGTSIKEGKLISSGGRVLGVTGIGSSLDKSIHNAYQASEMIKFSGMYYRKDIGRKGLKNI